MADINVEKRGATIWPWIFGLIVAALLIWALMGVFGEDEAEMTLVEPAAEQGLDPAVPPITVPTTPATAPAEGIPAEEILTAPGEWTSRSVEGEVVVREVPSDRAFWTEIDGRRLLVILNDSPEEQPIDVNPGQTLQISNATVQDDVAGVSGELDDATRTLVEQQPAFLTVNQEDVQISEATTPAF